jgi:Na+/H+-translocating membrane pyrophosphatase
MILGGALANKAGFDFETKSGFILFPLVVHSLDLLVSTISVYFVRTKPGLPQYKHDYGELEDPLTVLKRGYHISLILATIGLYIICSIFLNNPQFPSASNYFFACSVIGILVSFMFIYITQYYTDYNYGPV